jgi:integrase
VTNIIAHPGQLADPLAVIDTAAHLAPTTQVKYKRILAAYLATGESLSDAQALAEFANTLSQSRQAHLRAAVNLWADATTRLVKSQATPDNLAHVDATIHRLTALKTAVQPRPQKGSKLHTWLTKDQVKKLLNIDIHNLRNLRDRLALSLMVGAGLRRQEAAMLRLADVQAVPGRHVIQVMGKGSKRRAVPISVAMSQLIATWQRETNITGGRLLRSIAQNGTIGDSLSAVSLFKIVQAHGKRIGLPFLAPHDLRRTYAQFGYENGIDIGEISRLLGHSSIKTTQRYLNLETNLQNTISDHVPL